MEFCDLVRTARERQWSTSRQFHAKADLPCSYFYYTKVEKGTVPELPLAIAILRALDINLRRGLYAWTRAQMPDDEMKAFFEDLTDGPSRYDEQTAAHRSLVINRMQAKLLATNPVYWEILVYSSCHHDVRRFTVEDLARPFQMDPAAMRRLVDDLYEYGLVDIDEERRIVTKEWLYVPYDQEFRPLRELNFKRSLDKFLARDAAEKYRTTITRLVTPEQGRQIHSYIDALLRMVVDLPDEMPPNATPFTVGVFAAPRSFGDA